MNNILHNRRSGVLKCEETSVIMSFYGNENNV